MVVSTQKKSNFFRASKTFLALAALLSLTVGLSACTEQAKPGAQSSSLLSEPIMDKQEVQEDFAFPSSTPSLMNGHDVYLQNNCSKCHVQGYWQNPSVKQDLAYTTPIDLYLMLTTGTAPTVTLPTKERHQLMVTKHPIFRDKISRDNRWAVVFYTRYLAGAGDIKSPDPKTEMPAIFGGNCAVCHGSKGQGDGFLYTGKTGNHELMNATQTHNLNPQPANFQQYDRVYNRTDAQLQKYLCEGIYPSAMPAWYGNVNLDKDTGKITYIFDDKMLTNMVRYVRTWAYKNDLDAKLPEAITPPPGLESFTHCSPAATNRPWTDVMRNSGPNKGSHFVLPAADPITGGMVHIHGEAVPPVSESAVPQASAAVTPPGGQKEK